MRIRERALSYVEHIDHDSKAWKALQAYLDGINQYQFFQAEDGIRDFAP